MDRRCAGSNVKGVPGSKDDGGRPDRSFHAWSYTWSVLGSATVAIAVAVWQRAEGLAGTLGGILSGVPLWVTGPVTFLAAWGLINITQAVLSWGPRQFPDETQSHEYDPPQLDTADSVEIDLRSTAPVVVLFSTQLPEIDVTLRITNHTSHDLTVTHLTISVWFSQPTTDLALGRPFEVLAHSTRDDVFLRKLLEDSATKAIKAYYAREEDWSRMVALDISISGTSKVGPFQRSRHFELHNYEIKGIVR